jgi:putative addiction module killer protein
VIEVRQTEAFREWLMSLRDRAAAAIVARRLARVAGGNLGDVKPIGDGLSELRVHVGPGYRIYLARRGEALIVVLAGSDKSAQDRTIRAAKRMARELDL